MKPRKKRVAVRRIPEPGEQFGEWTITGAVEARPYVNRKGSAYRLYYMPCRCSCGQEQLVSLNNLENGLSLRCRACSQIKISSASIKHGLSASGEHRIWRGMQQRCGNPRNPNFNGYGERGIAVCERWQGRDGFANFYADMGPRPSPGHTVDRKDNDKGYEPSNCRWVTIDVQASNKRNNVLLTFDGRTQTMSQWARELGISSPTIHRRMYKLGWPVDRVLGEPPMPSRQNRKRRVA